MMTLARLVSVLACSAALSACAARSEEDLEALRSARSDKDLLNIPARYIDTVLRDGLNADFNKPFACTAYRARAIETPWRNHKIDDQIVKQIDDISLIRELTDAKEKCDFNTDRAKILEREIVRRNLLEVKDIVKLRGFGWSELGTRALVLEANDGSNAVKTRTTYNGREIEVWNYRKPNHCVARFALENGIVVGRNLVYCSDDGRQYKDIDGIPI